MGLAEVYRRFGEGGRYGVLYPAIAEAAHRAGADAIGLIDVSCWAGFNLNVDRVGITYSNGQTLGDPASPAQVSCSVVGRRPVRPVSSRVMPEVVARIGTGLNPVDVTDAEQARWLRAGAGPERLALLDAELALASAASPVLLRGDAADVLPDAFARVPLGVLPVVTTTWALSAFSLEGRLRFLQRLDEAAAERAVAWVSVEGVGVAPAMPTFGDRRASGHSIVGVAVFGHRGMRAEGVGRCWSRGRLMSWLSGS